MAEAPNPAARVGPADQAIVHLTAFLALEGERDATWEAFRRELEQVLPRANRAVPAIGRLAALAEGIVRPANRGELVAACERVLRDIAAYHKARAAAALEAMRTGEGGTP